NLDHPEARRVTFYTSKNHIFYLELAVDRTEFVKLYDFDGQEEVNPDELLAQTQAAQQSDNTATSTAPQNGDGGDDETDALLKSLGM
ncbi:MAG: DUF3334 family protein, partial [Macromonas sp.]